MTKRKVVNFGIKNDQTNQNYEAVGIGIGAKQDYKAEKTHKEAMRLTHKEAMRLFRKILTEVKPQGKVEETDKVALRIKQKGGSP